MLLENSGFSPISRIYCLYILEVGMKTKLFLSNKTQAVRLPKEVAFPEGVVEVEVHVVGDARVITPAGRGLEWWFEHGAKVSEDFMLEREEVPEQERDWWD
jgi:antitoxin VapB